MTIDLTVRDGIAEIVLNRPEALNAIDPDMRALLREVWTRVHEDDGIRVAIVTGAGERAFCVGSDLKKTPPPPESYAQRAFGQAQSDHLLATLRTDKPLIAAINGLAVGGGMEIALACDLRIASQTASFGLSEVRVGSIPGAGGTQRLPRMIGSATAMQMLLTGDRIDAAEAHRVGLVSELCPPDRLLPRAWEIAARIASNAPLAVRAVKRLVHEGADMPLETGLRVENYVWGLIRDTEDRLEGRTAFQEKRPPEYRGR
jgi:E-phenylitaconyl-CoA hydratase